MCVWHETCVIISSLLYISKCCFEWPFSLFFSSSFNFAMFRFFLCHVNFFRTSNQHNTFFNKKTVCAPQPHSNVWNSTFYWYFDCVIIILWLNKIFKTTNENTHQKKTTQRQQMWQHPDRMQSVKYDRSRNNDEKKLVYRPLALAHSLVMDVSPYTESWYLLFRMFIVYIAEMRWLLLLVVCVYCFCVLVMLLVFFVWGVFPMTKRRSFRSCLVSKVNVYENCSSNTLIRITI